MRRKAYAAVCACLLVAPALGCSHSKTGNDHTNIGAAAVTDIPTTPAPETAPAGKTAPATPAAPPPPPPAQLVTPAKINSILLPLDEVSSIVGATLGYEKTRTTPTAPVNIAGNNTPCTVLFGMDANAFGQDANWQAFRNDRQQESESAFDHLVYQRAGIYGDTKEPTTLFHNAFQATNACNNAVVHNTANEANTDWQFQGPTVTGNRAQWTNSELVNGKPNGWGCAHDVRVKNNVLFEAQVCAFSDTTQLAATIADRMGNWIPA